MQINNVISSQIIQKKQNFKGSSVSSSPFLNFPNYKQVSLNVSEAYASPQITQSYKEIETFDVPYVGQGKLYELANGHKVVIIKKNGPTVINTFVKAGRNESLINSHLLEHLLYEPNNKVESKTLSDFYIKHGIERRAMTWDNYTNYYMKYPFKDSKSIDSIIKTQADLLQKPNITNEVFETQKNVIFAEYTRKSFKNDAEKIDRLFINTLLNGDKKLDGYDFSKESIDNITLNELMGFHKKYYQNNNMISVIVGDVNSDEVLKSFAKHFNKANGEAIQSDSNPKKLLQNSQEITPRQEGIKNVLQIGFVGPQRNNIKDCFLDSAFGTYVNYISQKPSGIKLEKHYIVNGRKSTDHVGIIFVANFQEGKEKETREKINKYLHKLVEEPLSSEDITIIKARLKDSLSKDGESALQISTNIGESLAEGNSTIDSEKYKLVDSLTAKDFQDYAKKYIDFNKQLTMVFANPQTDNIKSPSFKGNVNSINTDNIKEYTLSNNLKFVVDTSPEIKRTTFSIVLKYPNQNNDNKDLSMVLQKMMAVVSPVNSKFIRENDGGVEIQGSSNYLKIISNTIPENTLQAISVAKNILLNPILNQRCFDYVKKVYPNDFDWDKIKLSDVVNYYKELSSSSEGKAILTLPQNTFDKNQDKIINSLSKNIPNFKKEEKNLRNSFTPYEKPEIKFKEIIGDNAYVSQSFKIPDTDYADSKTKLTLLLLKTAISGYPNARLFKELVENQGISYVVGTYDKKGQLEIFVETPASKKDSSNIKKVLDTTQTKVNELINNPISEEELKDIKNCLKGYYINSIESSRGKNSLLSTFDTEEVKDLFPLIDKITSQDIQNAVKEYLSKPSHILIKTNKEVGKNNILKERTRKS